MIADVVGAFQVLFQEQCALADVAYTPPVIVCTRSRLNQTGTGAVDERKAAKPGKKDEKTTKSPDDRAGWSFYYTQQQQQILLAK